jgi:lysophospholipid acyltransferase (LPLAT)-like uncharacterized protein
MSTPPKDDHDPFNTKRPAVHDLGIWQKLVFYPLAWLTRLWLMTLRIEADAAARQCARDTVHPLMVVTWHNRSLIMPEVSRKLLDLSRVACLISASKMAAWEVAFYRMYRLRIVRGSTTRRSIQAAREMFRELKRGHSVGISPDGPSGPLYSFQPGAVAMARKAGVPMLVIVPNCRQAYRMKSWDRHLIPLPFAKVTVSVVSIPPDHPAYAGTNEEASMEFQRVCLEITEDPFNAPEHD